MDVNIFKKSGFIITKSNIPFLVNFNIVFLVPTRAVRNRLSFVHCCCSIIHHTTIIITLFIVIFFVFVCFFQVYDFTQQ